MIVDSSAIVALLRVEDEAETFAAAIGRAGSVGISAATYLETSLVLGAGQDLRLDRFVASARAVIEPVTARQAQLARLGYRTFGRGSGSPARLNFGDCFSYALAMDKREPLLFKGDNFGHTDVLVAS